MAKNISEKKYDAEITSMIEGFVQMWIKFESLLHKEMAKTQQFNSPPDMAIGNNYDNYSLFYRVSSVVYPKRQQTMGELSSALSVPYSKATRMISWLVDNGYVKRLSDPDDRRIVRVTLTEKGNALHQAISNYMRERIQELLATSLTNEEKIILFTLIKKVVSTLRNLSA